jgi:hypothetical protein
MLDHSIPSHPYRSGQLIDRSKMSKEGRVVNLRAATHPFIAHRTAAAAAAAASVAANLVCWGATVEKLNVFVFVLL